MKPLDQVLWYINQPLCPPLQEPLQTDVLVIGGGIAGLSAAQSFHEKGLSVALIEKNFCGSGASGKSSGFITPDSEYSLHNLIRVYGEHQGKNLWEFATSGVNFIRNNIKKFALACDYIEQDTVVVATSSKKFKNEIEEEHKTREKFNYKSILYSPEKLPYVLNSNGYYGAIRYTDSFGICAYRYCQEMKKILMQQGVKVFEDTPALRLVHNQVITPWAAIKAQHIIVCVDRFINNLTNFSDVIYQIQTFLMMSAPLSDLHVKLLFPEQQFMIWDTNLIYNYYRIDAFNRLMLGGAYLFSTYSAQEEHKTNKVQKKLLRYFKEKFPQVPIEFNYIWPGLIGISKDIMPIAGHDKSSPALYYISGAAGLPWAAALGIYSAESIIEKRNDLNDIFSPYRKFPLGQIAQKFLGTKLTFALSNFMTTKSL